MMVVTMVVTMVSLMVAMTAGMSAAQRLVPMALLWVDMMAETKDCLPADKRAERMVVKKVAMKDHL